MAETDEAFEEKVETLAQKLLRGGDGNEGAATDIEAARRSARRMLEDSEERTIQALDLEEDDVIRRSSSETAATGEGHGVKYTNDGE